MSVPTALRTQVGLGIVLGGILMMMTAATSGETIELNATGTLTPVELDRGESVRFRLKSGATRELTLDDAYAEVVFTNLDDTKVGERSGRSIYRCVFEMTVDGHPLKLIRHAPVQESYYEPLVINGLRVWPDATKDLGEHFNENHGECLPVKDARFAIQDATLPICAEQELRPWYPNPDNRLDVRDAYQGDDVWMGPYFGADLHAGLDVNMPITTPLWAPLDFDEQLLFHTVEEGYNNNRWRGVRTWPDGRRWRLHAHHVSRVHVPDNAPITRGTHFADAAGHLVGLYSHSHFEFKIDQGDATYRLDPWIVFHQIFENNRRRAGEIHAEMVPLSPARVGEPVRFSAAPSRQGILGGELVCSWSFGDGAVAYGRTVEHVFTRPGVYAVMLHVDDATHADSAVQHITVDGEASDTPALGVEVSGVSTFEPRPAGAVDAYGAAAPPQPNLLRISHRGGVAEPSPSQYVDIVNLGGGQLGALSINVTYPGREGWLAVDLDRESRRVRVSTRNIGRFQRERYDRAIISVHAEGAVNSPQRFVVERFDLHEQPKDEVVVHHRDAGCELSPGGWIEPRYRQPWPAGHKGSFLVASPPPGQMAYARFRPRLVAGRYAVTFADATPFDLGRSVGREPLRLPVRVRHAHGEAKIMVTPTEDRTIGTFEFPEGIVGYVQVETEGARGLVLADAVRFRRIVAAEASRDSIKH